MVRSPLAKKEVRRVLHATTLPPTDAERTALDPTGSVSRQPESSEMAGRVSTVKRLILLALFVVAAAVVAVKRPQQAAAPAKQRSLTSYPEVAHKPTA
jgi:hypothetical protein